MKTLSLGRRRALQLALLTTLVGLLSVAAAGVAGGAPTPSKFKASAVAPDGATIVATKSLTSRVAKTDPSLVGRTDSTPVNVMVKLAYDPVASYQGTVAGYAATSPKVTGKRLRANGAAVSRYEQHIATLEGSIAQQIRDRLGSVTIRDSYRTVYGGVAMTVPANKIGDLLAVPGVVAVQKDELRQPLTDATPAFVGASSAWTKLGGSNKAGEGVIVGVIDTGIWPEHPSFADPGISKPAGSWACEFGVSGQPDDGAYACNDKLIGAYAFTDTYMSAVAGGALPGEFCNNATDTCSARDADGHGTHTASTAAGAPVSNATLLGVNRGSISGMAPGAHVIAYRVCMDQGCFSSDSVAAVGQAITDGVDVINFSISGGASAYTDPVELAFLDAYDAGILVNASAGNEGPGVATANHAGAWVNTVGASTSNRHFFATLNLGASNGDTLALQGVTVTAGITSATTVVVNTVDPLCLNPAAPGTFTGKVVVCKRGTNARVDKGYNVLQGGAAGMILYNPAIQQLNSDNHWLPAIHIEGPDTGTGNAAKLVGFLGSHTGVTARWTGGTASPVLGDVMASFSSRGPLGDFIKPDVTAPGVQILAGMTPDPFDGNITVGPRGQLYQAIAGTSMSSPHSAGVAALVKAAHPDWTPGQIKSALMTSSVQSVVKEDGTTSADPFDRGAGSIRADRAVNPTVTFDVPASEYYSSAGDPLGRIHLNLPSVNAPTMPGSILTTRTMKNVSGHKVHLQAAIAAPAGSEIKVTPSSFSLDPGASRTIEIVIDGKNLAKGQQYFGQITLKSSKGSDVVIPVAFVTRQSTAVSLSHACSPLVFPLFSASTCQVKATNMSFSPANVKLALTGGNYMRLPIQGVTPPGVSNPLLDGFTWAGALAPAQPANVHIGAGSSPAGYVPLSAFGIAPVGGVGDETITNFNVPAFEYAGETHSRLGLVSNGYLVVDGGTSADVSYLNQSLPNAARPNNVLAPFWTDLNPGAGGAVRIGILTDGVDDWIVIDYAGVKEYSTAKTVSFNVWIGINGTEDISFAYGTVQGNGDLGYLTVGAENSTGSRGENRYVDGVGTLPAAGAELRVASDPPAPGGSATIGYKAVGRMAGKYQLVASMTSDLTPGTTQEVQNLQVTGVGR